MAGDQPLLCGTEIRLMSWIIAHSKASEQEVVDNLAKQKILQKALGNVCGRSSPPMQLLTLIAVPSKAHSKLISVTGRRM